MRIDFGKTTWSDSGEGEVGGERWGSVVVEATRIGVYYYVYILIFFFHANCDAMSYAKKLANWDQRGRVRAGKHLNKPFFKNH